MISLCVYCSVTWTFIGLQGILYVGKEGANEGRQNYTDLVANLGFSEGKQFQGGGGRGANAETLLQYVFPLPPLFLYISELAPCQSRACTVRIQHIALL